MPELVTQVLQLAEWVLKGDPLACAAMLAHLNAVAAPPLRARHSAPARSGGGGGDDGSSSENESNASVWRKVACELQVTMRSRLLRLVNNELEPISDTMRSHGSAKHMPVWVSKVPTLVCELIASHSTPTLLAPTKQQGAASHELVQDLCQQITAAALSSLAGLAASGLFPLPRPSPLPLPVPVPAPSPSLP